MSNPILLLFIINYLFLFYPNHSTTRRLSSNLIYIIANPNIVQLAYELIKSNDGNCTKGTTDNDTISEMSNEWILEISMKSSRASFS